MPGRVQTIRSGCGKLFVSITHDYKGRIVDIFANPNNEGGCTSNLNAMTIIASKALRAGVCIDDIIDGLSSHTCSNFVKQKAVRKERGDTEREIAKGSSCPSAIGHLLRAEKERLARLFPETYHHSAKEIENAKLVSDPELKCPDCGAKLQKAEGCLKCPCGFSRC
jgi:ribonucleoside-diphosphate reductase alpha chain